MFYHMTPHVPAAAAHDQPARRTPAHPRTHGRGTVERRLPAGPIVRRALIRNAGPVRGYAPGALAFLAPR